MKLLKFPIAVLTGLVASVALHAQAPVPVREEPFHKVTLENDYIRMIDVHIAPGATSLYHVHVIPSVVVNLTNTTLLSPEWGKPMPASRKVAAGSVRYAPYDEVPLTHQVTNQSPEIFHVLDIELLRPKSREPWGPAIAVPALKLEWEQPLVRAYKAHLEAAKPTEIPADGRTHLWVAVTGEVKAQVRTDGTESARSLAAGEYLFLPANSAFQLRAAGEGGAECVLLELR